MSASQKALSASLLPGPVFYLAPDAVSAREICAVASSLSGKKCVLLSSRDEVLAFREAFSRDSAFRRISSVQKALGADIIVSDPVAAMQLFPESVETLELETDGEADMGDTMSRLAAMGFERTDAVAAPGEFSSRGDILDIYPIDFESPLRVEFFGDAVERMRFFDPSSGERLGETESFSVTAATDVRLGDGDERRIIETLERQLKTFKTADSYVRAEEIRDKIEIQIAAGDCPSYVAPLLGSSKRISEFLPPETTVVFDECKKIEDAATAAYSEHVLRFKELSAAGEAYPFCLAQMEDPKEMLSSLKGFRCVAVQEFAQSTMFFNPLQTVTFSCAPCPSYLSSYSQLFEDIESWRKGGYRVLLFAANANRAERLREELETGDIFSEDVPDTLAALESVAVCAGEIGHGFILHDEKLVFIGDRDLFTKAAAPRIKRRRGDLFLTPEIGDYCIHEVHGIGKIVGTKRISTTESNKEYVAIEYAGGDMLYVPVEQMNTLSKYVGPTPALSRIGGEFQKTKERARKSIRKLAIDLKALYAERSAKRGFAFEENGPMMDEFEESFEFEETEDQLTSIAEIKADMCSDKVMDRLLCGDVGYGKTEVAFRAVYLCVLSGKQAALLCPSTILCEQHFNTAAERFKEFGVRIEKLNRFATAKEQKRILDGLKEGKVDFVIGTHRLLSKDVEFHDLGLLILDEEQRFGVAAKEKIKAMKSDVDCLAMSATPIPRTLHMSLSGMRDISTINTPPRNRLPVQTYVVEESETLIRDSCMRELSRGGQVFIVYNRVETIYRFTQEVRAILPEARVICAHGRMEKRALEDAMISFYNGDSDILVTTSIIENGIDLPNANTMIVIDSDRFGISQLYQFRGRVGRSTRLAHAYFTFKGDKVLTADAAERLKAITRYTELGSGFNLAMRDLEIRGAGNVLGAEQHGHMESIGYELYSKILKEELEQKRSVSAVLDIRCDAFIPESYMQSSHARMDCYKQIAEMAGEEDYERITLSLEDGYGKIPKSLLNLLDIALVKAYASRFCVTKIAARSSGGEIELDSLDDLADGKIDAALKKYSRVCTLKMRSAPVLSFSDAGGVGKIMEDMTDFLKYASNFSQEA